MSILIGADMVPTESNADIFLSGDIDSLVGQELKNILLKADYSIFNLEVPLTDKETPIPKCGPNLIAPTLSIKAYVSMKVDLLTLANNHVVDQDIQGLRSTCRTLDENNIAYLGVGENSHDAAKPHFFDFAGKRIGVYACCEHEFGVASEKSAGANPFDPLESLDHIFALKQECDYVIVLYHGGKEHYRYPSPMLQKTCRKIVDKGADLVICQHSHCIGCEEKYNNGTIVYGQGNFLFDYSENECWQTSLLIKLDKEMNVSYIPLKKHGNSVRLASDNEATQILNNFNIRSNEIKQKGFIERKYQEFADSMLENYLFAVSGVKRNLVFKIFNKFSGGRFKKYLLKRKYTCDKKLVLQNFVECEAHRELFLEGLKNYNA